MVSLRDGLFSAPLKGARRVVNVPVARLQPKREASYACDPGRRLSAPLAAMTEGSPPSAHGFAVGEGLAPPANTREIHGFA